MAIKKIKINGIDHELQTSINNVANLQTALDSKQATITGAASTITGANLTANRALISNDSGKVAVSDITSTELSYLDNTTSNIQNQLNTKTFTSVIPNDNGEIKTKFRLAQKGYTSNSIWYYKICTLPINDSGNYASAILSGRIGGWSVENISYINALVWNRSNPGIALLDITGTATSMSNVWSISDLVLYVNGSSTTAANTATLYVKCNGYFTFDLDLELFQSTASIVYDGSYITTTPSGTLVTQASTTPRRVEVVNKQMLINGVALLPVDGNAASATKDASGNIITTTYETKSDATLKLNEAKSYATSQATQVKNELLNGAGAAYDTLKELGDLIDKNVTAIDALKTVASNKMDKVNPEGSGTFSFGRLAGSTIGTRSIVLGSDTIASGKDSVAIGRKGSAEGDYATSIGYSSNASGDNSVVIGVNSVASAGNSVVIGSNSAATNWNDVAIGAKVTASGSSSLAAGYGTEATGYMSTAMGYLNQATSGAQTVFGSLNIPDTNSVGPESRTKNIMIVGNGLYDEDAQTRSNAMTLGWDGTAWFAGDVYVKSTSGTNFDNGSKKLITADEVLITVADIDEICGNSIQSATDLTY